MLAVYGADDGAAVARAGRGGRGCGVTEVLTDATVFAALHPGVLAVVFWLAVKMLMWWS